MICKITKGVEHLKILLISTVTSINVNETQRLLTNLNSILIFIYVAVILRGLCIHL